MQHSVLPCAQQPHGETLPSSHRCLEGVLLRRDSPGGAAREIERGRAQKREQTKELSQSNEGVMGGGAGYCSGLSWDQQRSEQSGARPLLPRIQLYDS